MLKKANCVFNRPTGPAFESDGACSDQRRIPDSLLNSDNPQRTICQSPGYHQRHRKFMPTQVRLFLFIVHNRQVAQIDHSVDGLDSSLRFQAVLCGPTEREIETPSQLEQLRTAGFKSTQSIFPISFAEGDGSI
jgi:hypothetical protein